MNQRSSLFSAVLFFCAVYSPLFAQSLSDSTRTHELGEVVVTATRSEKVLSALSVPTTIISGAEIQQRGRSRLADVLSDLPNMNIRYNYGAGVQLQGLDPAYTLILVDGEPVIGRTAGTLDLNRINLHDVERIEIVRGPSSSLYGSEALAGVINIITKKTQEQNRAEVRLQYETHHTLDAGFTTELRRGDWGWRNTFSRYSSAGYSLTSQKGIDPTVPPFTDYAASSQLDFHRDHNRLRISGRWAQQTQKSITNVLNVDRFVLHDQNAQRTDWSTGAQMNHRFSLKNQVEAKLYASRYQTELNLTPVNGGAPEITRYDQTYAKAETQYNYTGRPNHLTIAGAGSVLESVMADRIAGGRRYQHQLFIFGQHDWVGQLLDLTGSIRMDAHSEYGTHLSPKLSSLLKPNAQWRIRASVGSGFKAPTFQQLYMDFNNPLIGYNVYGTTGIQAGLQRLVEQGQIQEIIHDPKFVSDIKPENSWAFNIGLNYQPNALWLIQTNAFRNNVRNLIETTPVALKTNGQQVYTYSNLAHIYTQGIESEVNFRRANVSVTASYTFLDTADLAMLEKIRNGELYTTNAQNIPRRMTRAQYGGLFNRSKHSATLRITRDIHLAALLATDTWDFSVTMRGQFTGRYAYDDRNGNLVPDIASEYVTGYLLLHLNLTKPLSTKGQLIFGAENLANQTRPKFIPSLSGRLWHLGFQYSL